MVSDRSWRVALASSATSKRLCFHLVALDGSKITVDRDRNRAFYGAEATPVQILRGETRLAPQYATELATLAGALARYSAPKPDTAP
jgi:lipid-binding SYLF domain-containing protein